MIAAAALFLSLLLCSPPCSEGVKKGLYLGSEKAQPAQFPFFVASALLVRSGLTDKLSSFFAKPLSAVYRLPPETAPILILGLTGGYPVGAATAAELVSHNAASPDDAARANLFCNCASPGFCVGLVGLGVFGNAKTGAVLYGIHILSALLTGLICSRNHEIRSSLPVNKELHNESFPSAFCGAVTKSASTALDVTAFLVMFSVLISLLRPVLGMIPFGPALVGILELTNGLLRLPMLPAPVRLSLVSFLLGFGGLAVHFQVRAVSAPCGLPVNGFTEAKLLHGSIASVITILVYRASPSALETFLPSPQTTTFMFPLWALTILLSALAFFSGKKARNRV